MEFTTREYQMSQTKSCFKVHKICFFFQNSTEKASDWISTEQKVDNLNFSYYKLNIRAAQKVIKSSIHILNNSLISSTTALLFQKKNFINFNKFSFEKISSVFVLLAIKINSTVYSTKQFKNLTILHYSLIMLKMYHFALAHVKLKRNSILSK